MAEFKFGAWEVEKTAMDVQADEARLKPDPFTTGVVERTVADSQGQLFGDAHPTYADTDKIAAVGRGGGTPSPGPARWLRPSGM